MKATFKGHVSVDRNAVFTVVVNAYGFTKEYELKDDIDADKFVIGEEYEIDGLVK